MEKGKAQAGKTGPATLSNSSLVRIYRNFKLEFIMFGVLFGIMILLQLITGNALKSRNVMNIFQAATPIIIMAMGQLMIVVTGGIDLSVGSIYSLSGMVGALAINQYGILPGIALALITGMACGLFNGFFVSILRMAPFIVTLAMNGIAASLTFIIADGNSQSIMKLGFKQFDRGNFLFGIPNYITYILVIVVVIQFVLRKTIFGRWVYATGSNEEAARLVGVPTSRVKLISYTLTGVFCALAAMLNASYLMTVECTAGTGMELSVIAATVIGGASLSGGIGSAVGAFIGAMISVVIRNGFNLMGVNSFWQGTVTGVVIIVAVLFGTLSANKRNRS